MGKNKILEKNDEFVIIELTQGQQTTIDTEDYDKIKDIRWTCDRVSKNKNSICYNQYYCRSSNKTIINNKQRSVSLSRFLLNVIDNNNVVVDHIDHNTLCNRKFNLRVCSQQENCFNNRKSQKKSSTSKYKGVMFSKRLNCFRSRIRVNKKEINLGQYKEEHNAAHAYNKAAIKHFGVFANINKNLPKETKEYTKYKGKNKYKGVSFHKQRKKYQCRITVNKKEINLGFFEDPIDAAKTYNEAAIKYRGEKAKLNKII